MRLPWHAVTHEQAASLLLSAIGILSEVGDGACAGTIIKHILKEADAMVLTALLSLLSVFREYLYSFYFLHVIGLAIHVVDYHDFA